jgi:putative ABC transport system permease protein
MTVHPIIAALRKHKAGVRLIGLQIALTLAIVCNAVFIIAQQVQRIQRPTGLDESGLFLVTQRFVGPSGGTDPASIEKLDSLQLADIAALRTLPDVESVAAVSSLPLLNDTWSSGVSLQAGQPHETTHATYFFGDQHMLRTLGLHLLAGRDFSSLDIGHFGFRSKIEPSVVIVTRALANKLFPRGNAIGEPVYLGGATTPSVIVGEVARLLTSAAGHGADSFAWDSVLIPARRDLPQTRYAVRARPGRLREAMHAAGAALYAVNPMRVIEGDQFGNTGIHSYAHIRKTGYLLESFELQVLTIICVILLAVTGVGITGLTSFWVNQRQKQIGIRRALGARRIDILRYFQIENLLIAGGGCIAGAVLALGLNLALLRLFALPRMPTWYLLLGVAVVLALGQLAVFMPARRASNVPPVVATRTV